MVPMATSSRRVAAPKTARPFVRVEHSQALHDRTLLLLETLEAADDATEHRDALSALVIELTDNGLDYCFMKPLKLAKVGFIAEQAAGLGMVGMRQLMGSVVRQVIGRMDGPQLLSVCGSIRVLMR